MSWTSTATDTHQDHVIAHVIGATPVSYFTWDETAYLVLDIGFVWNIYLDLQMGLVPERLAFSELGTDIDALQITEVESSPIVSVEAFEDGEERQLVLNCEQGRLVIESSLSHRWMRIAPHPSL